MVPVVLVTMTNAMAETLMAETLDTIFLAFDTVTEMAMAVAMTKVADALAETDEAVAVTMVVISIVSVAMDSAIGMLMKKALNAVIFFVLLGALHIPPISGGDRNEGCKEACSNHFVARCKV